MSANEHNDDHHDHGIGHVASKKVLLSTFGALMVLTVITVAATKVDVGSAGNLTIAMVIATIKAGLVCAYFMHLRYDKLAHTIAILGALLFVMLFVGFTLMDSSEYKDDVIWETAPE